MLKVHCEAAYIQGQRLCLMDSHYLKYDIILKRDIRTVLQKKRTDNKCWKVEIQVDVIISHFRGTCTSLHSFCAPTFKLFPKGQIKTDTSGGIQLINRGKCTE